jgi:excinuclease ABC subunit A
MPELNDHIVVRGARLHNLKGLDCDIPHNALTVVTGVSGSGKSSLAFDTIYAEGQRRYVESLSAYARQFLERMEKPEVESIEGLAPSIAIRQKNSTRNPRSTVATATEIYDYMRLLWARTGTTYCLVCGNVVKRDSVDEITDAVLALEDGTRLYALFPLRTAEPGTAVSGSPDSSARSGGASGFKAIAAAAGKVVKSTAKKLRKTTDAADDVQQSQGLELSDAMRERLTDLRRRGFNRLLQGGQIFEFSTPESLLDVDFRLPVFVLVDRLVVTADAGSRLADAAEIAYREAGEVIFEEAPHRVDPAPGEAAAEPGAVRRFRFSQAFECKHCHTQALEPEPRLFSFNNPFGACPRCQGFGNTIDFDLSLAIPAPGKTLEEGAIEPWTRPKYRPYHGEMRRFARDNDVPMDVPWEDLSESQQDLILHGRGTFPGLMGFFEQLERKKYKLHVRVFLSRYRGYALCPECRGQRLRAEARAVKLDGRNICEAAGLTVAQARQFFATLRLTPMQAEIAGKVLEEIQKRLGFLQEVGLEYLTLDRLSSTLSGGESQRIQLASSLGSQLVGALYVLDEPSIGLHSRDTARLVRILRDLRDLGNTMIVVEHDANIIEAADYLLDLGPGAGELGGKLLAAGTVADVEANPASLTGRYLSGRLSIPVPSKRRKPDKRWLRLKGGRANNIRNLDVDIPLDMLVGVTGVSGSGKSSLVHQILGKALAYEIGPPDGSSQPPVYKDLSGASYLSEFVLVDQSPIGRTPRSNPVTYIKTFDAIRELFAAQPESQRRGYGAGHFSFNVPGGRCEVCQGDGTVTVEMQFLADVDLPCEECGGKRYKATVLEILYKGRNIYDVLNMTVREAVHFFAGHPKIVDRLAVLEEVGLGYIRLGQPASTLSGGEAQRVKLASHLANIRTAGGKRGKRVLYILDEPTTGLHFEDISKLLAAFRKLIDNGGSLLVIEHNLDVLKSADWIIDMGPEGGSGGGKIVATGTPEQVAQVPESYTGQWLAKVLRGKPHVMPAKAAELRQESTA